MKHQQVVVDYWSMLKTSGTCLLLAISGYILIKMVQTVFWLPRYLQSNQKRLEDLAAMYAVELNKEDIQSIEEEIASNGTNESNDQNKEGETRKNAEPSVKEKKEL